MVVDESEAARTQVGEALRQADFLVTALGNAEAALRCGRCSGRTSS
jgi:hypothetical protein